MVRIRVLFTLIIATATVAARAENGPTVAFVEGRASDAAAQGPLNDHGARDAAVPPASIEQAATDSPADPKPAKPAEKPKPKKKPKPKTNPATTAYKGVYYDNDFSYLNDPENQDVYLGDLLKQIKTTPNSVLDMGGEYRMRDHHEFNFRNSGPVGSNLKGLSDDFLLQRERLYVNWRYGKRFRFYGEAINATSSFQRYTPRNIEVNPWDALNLFVDGQLLDGARGELWGRGGRQELLYGAQRLISPLDWVNTRRTFDGGKMFWKGDEWNIDAFWTEPVLPGQHILGSTGPTTGRITHEFDHPDSGQMFAGTYATYKGIKDHALDYFYLLYLEDKAPNIENAIFAKNFVANTFGTRFFGRQGSWLYEIEGGYQFGTWGNGIQSSGYYVLGGGYELSERPWKPTLWTYYDWASGNRNPNSANHGTFIQMFPFAHKYFGFMDLVARQNIRDLNFQLTATPNNKTTLLAWYHIFELDQARDSLYNSQGLAIRTDPTGKSGRNVGQEIDATVQYQINPRADVLIGYSHFFAGSFVKNTNPVGVSGNADFYYSQWSYRF
ncbi:MAG TPA: alginate export family protein [Pirellulales bacterium]|nr:alginate export family protein [Pirellulales bacterium]